MSGGRTLYRLDPRTSKFVGYDIGKDLPQDLYCCSIDALHQDIKGISTGLEPLAGWFGFDPIAGTTTRYQQPRAIQEFQR